VWNERGGIVETKRRSELEPIGSDEGALLHLALRSKTWADRAEAARATAIARWPRSIVAVSCKRFGHSESNCHEPVAAGPT
jgi:hypothetical protein